METSAPRIARVWLVALSDGHAVAGRDTEPHPRCGNCQALAAQYGRTVVVDRPELAGQRGVHSQRVLAPPRVEADGERVTTTGSCRSTPSASIPQRAYGEFGVLICSIGFLFPSFVFHGALIRAFGTMMIGLCTIALGSSALSRIAARPLATPGSRCRSALVGQARSPLRPAETAWRRLSPRRRRTGPFQCDCRDIRS